MESSVKNGNVFIGKTLAKNKARRGDQDLFFLPGKTTRRERKGGKKRQPVRELLQDGFQQKELSGMKGQGLNPIGGGGKSKQWKTRFPGKHLGWVRAR